MRARSLLLLLTVILVSSTAYLLMVRGTHSTSTLDTSASPRSPQNIKLDPATRADETKKNQDGSSSTAKENPYASLRDLLKRRKIISVEEANKYLQLSGHSASSIGWAFCQTGRLEFLKEGLASYPQDALLNFLGAIASKLVDPTRADALNEIPALGLSSLEKLHPGFDVMAKLILETGLAPDDLPKLAAAGQQLLAVDDTLRQQDASFLQLIRDFDHRAAVSNAEGAKIGIGSTLLRLGAASTVDQTSLQALARTILADSSYLGAAVAGNTQEFLFSRKLNDDQAQALYGMTAEEFRQQVIKDKEELLGLVVFDAHFRKTASDAEYELFLQARAEIGERSALAQLARQERQVSPNTQGR